MQYLNVLSTALRRHNERVLFYLAAAVSDFYIPWAQLVSV